MVSSSSQCVAISIGTSLKIALSVSLRAFPSKHIASRRTHKHLYATHFRRINLFNFGQITIGGSHVKRIVGKWIFRHHSYFASNTSVVTVSGIVLGISIKEVTPPATAALDSLWIFVCQSGSRKCT